MPTLYVCYRRRACWTHILHSHHRVIFFHWAVEEEKRVRQPEESNPNVSSYCAFHLCTYQYSCHDACGYGWNCK